jgi:hypothetical protein
VWTHLIKQRPAAKLMIDLKLAAVFSHRRATRLKRLRRPKACSIRGSTYDIEYIGRASLIGVVPGS